MSGIRADIYFPRSDDCSNGGISSEVDEVTIVNADGPFEVTNDAPPVQIVKGNLPGTLRAIPVVESQHAPGEWVLDRLPGQAGPMFGGCFVHSSDSRFTEACERELGARFYGAVALHDRFESAELARALSS